MLPKYKSKFIIVFAVLVIVAIFIYIFRDKIFTPRYLGDLHMHTTCSDGKNTYEEMIQTAIKDKLSFIAITDHTICPETLAKCQTETRIVCFPGREVTTTRTHLLAIGIKNWPKDADFTWNGVYLTHMSLADQIKEIHRQGGIAIAAHPNAKDYYYNDSELKDSGIDAQECTKDNKERRFLPCVWDSDAHNTQDLAWQFNSCSLPIKNIIDLKTAILTHKCSRAISLPLFSVQNVNINKVSE